MWWAPRRILDKRLSKQAFQSSEEYKLKKRRRENAPKAKRQRLTNLWEGAKREAKRAAQRTESYKVKKRARENGREAQVKRKQRRQFERCRVRVHHRLVLPAHVRD